MPIKTRQAARAAADLVRDPLNYNAAMRFGDALADWSVMRWLYRRIIDELTPAEQAHLRDLTDRAVDLDALARLPPSTFGHAYARFMRDNQFRMGAQAESFPPIAATIERDWILRRFTRAHDLHHVVTGYTGEVPAEIGLQVFNWRNFGEPYGFLALLAVPVVIARYGQARRTIAEVWRGLTAGPRAKNLMTAPLEDWFERDLADVRRELGIIDMATAAAAAA